MDSREQPSVKSNASPRLFFLLLAVALWSIMVFGGFYTAKYYYDRSIQSVQQTNAMNIQALEDRLDNMSADMREIEKTLKNTGQSLSGSDTTQRALNRRIEELDGQLKELEKSLKALKEAPDAAR